MGAGNTAPPDSIGQSQRTRLCLLVSSGVSVFRVTLLGGRDACEQRAAEGGVYTGLRSPGRLRRLLRELSLRSC